MNSTAQNQDFNPSGVGLKNGNFIGLPYTEESARLILLPVPWDVTVSFRDGTSRGPRAILDASVQLDLADTDIPEAWRLGIFMLPPDQDLLDNNDLLRFRAGKYVNFLEQGGKISGNQAIQKDLEVMNAGCQEMIEYVYLRSKALIDAGKLIGIVGGDHSVPLGLLKALGEKYEDFGILHLDAHFDLRNAYEGFIFSHASIFFNALKEQAVSRIIQVGIRDYCEEEIELIEREAGRIVVFYEQKLKENRFEGMTWNEQCGKIIETLPERVYVSFDVDGLDPKLCPSTGTPVPGGLDFPEAVFLLKKVVESGRKIIGFDVCETGNNEWDANVAARIIYKLCNLTGRSNGLI